MKEHRFRREPRGFTLVELLVVIVILGVLSGVVVFAVSNLTGKSQASACAADERSIIEAEERTKATQGSYASEADLVSQGLLRGPSSLHDVVLAAGSYQVTPIGDCVSDELADGGGEPTPAAAFSVRLASSGGEGLEGATVEYSDGSWSELGVTDEQGFALGNLTPGSYEFRVDYRGQTQTTAATEVSDGATLDLHTVPVVVATGGAPGAAIAHLGNDGYWMTDEDTGKGGLATLELLEGSYTFRVDFNGATNLIVGVPVPKQSLVAFDVFPVTVFVGDPGVAVAHRGNNGIWIEDGETGKAGVVELELQPGDYEFRAEIKPGSHERTQASISGDSLVVFK